MDAATGCASKKRGPRESPAQAPAPKRRKCPEEIQSRSTSASKKVSQPPTTLALSASLEATLAELRLKYDVLVASVLSSTKIKTRIERVTSHLRQTVSQASASGGADGEGLPALVLLHARPAEVGKMITMVEKTKELLAPEGSGAIYQYNLLFELPPKPAEATIVEETVLEGGDREVGEESDDGFEKLEIFERAANPKAPARPVRAMGIFLSTVPVQELKSKAGITAQTTGTAPEEG
ncbi:uncharacterized protein DNG_09357 [Cephalotrichum gorgonifer]|uniref:DNA/RNA-binding protein Alba-like domain-containing protein n=1 Tax=Cephalotrichum gorgonifer TaxID=2041049 RepID=A0AAE8N5I0_9PEZI|nr:uncharacterized protein DNG_09357 [Cephalotrichum gorgonifer]